MKFISKVNNLRIVLQHGMPAEPLTGRAAVPGVYVKFENGIANINDEKMSQQMLNHIAFDSDFILAEDDKDPYEVERKSSEPEHDIAELKYGQVQKNISSEKQNPFSAEQLKTLDSTIKEEAKKLALAMVPELVKELANSGVNQGKKQAEDLEEKQEEEQIEDQGENQEEKSTTSKKGPKKTTSNKKK